MTTVLYVVVEAPVVPALLALCVASLPASWRPAVVSALAVLAICLVPALL